MVSIIIPAYNEEQALPRTLGHLLAQPGCYEVLVVDGGSTDRTLAIARSYGFGVRDSWSGVPGDADPHRDSSPHSLWPPSRPAPRASHLTLMSAPKGRASQMNAGAKRARGEWLLFLHADTVLPDGALTRLNALEADQAVQAGGFRHRFSGDDWRLRFISFLDNVRCARSRIIYGDQALFVRRSLFERLAGFPEQPILEDVAFGERLGRVTTPVLWSPPVLTDSRKFVKMGIWRSFLRVLLIILHVEFRLPVLPRAFFEDVR